MRSWERLIGQRFESGSGSYWQQHQNIKLELMIAPAGIERNEIDKLGMEDNKCSSLQFAQLMALILHEFV